MRQTKAEDQNPTQLQNPTFDFSKYKKVSKNKDQKSHNSLPAASEDIPANKNTVQDFSSVSASYPQLEKKPSIGSSFDDEKVKKMFQDLLG